MYKSHNKQFKQIRNAWHFWYAVVFGGESGLRKLGLCGIHPLTRRYALGGSFVSQGKRESFK
ncbi:DUF3265 domain-containing protein [Vibrio parahaemolyticus]|nr:DUF3265 domain-containing protein [Vibrio parahaemolyticus]